jgi:hypothetical protein
MIGDMKYQNKLVALFDQRSLNISYDIFIDYFENQNIIPSFFAEEDYNIDNSGENNTIIIKNWMMIAVLGILRMVDDYKNNEVKEGFELCPYATFSDPGNETAYAEIERSQIREGEWEDLFRMHSLMFTCYDKDYELKNWNAFLTYNGVKYFYYVQNLDHLIVEQEKHLIIHNTHKIYKFFYSSNPIDLITTTIQIQEIKWNDEHQYQDNFSFEHNWSAKIVYKQISLKEDWKSYSEIVKLLNEIDIEKYLSEDVRIRLHFPVVLPTYAFFNDFFKEHFETEYPEIVSLFTSDDFWDIFPNPNKWVLPRYEDSLKSNPIPSANIDAFIAKTSIIQQIFMHQIIKKGKK